MRRLALPRFDATVLTLGLTLRLFLLRRKSLWLDESMTLAISDSPWSELVGLVRTNELLPPLHYALMKAWRWLVPEPLFAMRLFSALCGFATLLLLRRLALRLVPAHARAALLIGALASFWIDLSQSGRPYALILLLGAGSLDLLLSRRRWAWAAACALGLYTHYYFAFWIAAQLAALGWREGRRWAGPAAAAALAFAPWLPSVLAQLRIYEGKPTLTEFLGWERLLGVFSGLFMNLSLTGLLAGTLPSWIGLGALCLLALGPFASRLEPEERRSARLLWVLLAVPLALAKSAEYALGRPMNEPRYFVYLSLPAYLLAALLWGRLRPLPRAAARAFLGLCAAGGLAGYFFASVFLDSRLGPLSEALRSAARPGEVVVHLNPFYYTSLRYYYLPERPHYLLDDRSTMLNWKALPGYPASAPASAIRRQKRVLVVDPERRLFPSRIGAMRGAEALAQRPL